MKTTIGAISNVVAGGTPSTKVREYWQNGTIPWMRSGEVNLRRIYDVEGRITELGLGNSNATLIPQDSILVALAGQGKTRGTVAINKISLTTNQSVAAIIPDKEIVDIEYLFFDLDRRYNELRRLSTGDGGRGGLNISLIQSISLLLPPLPEQRKIAEILGTWDEAIRLTADLIAAKQQRKKGLMQRLLTGEVRFPGFGPERGKRK
ncbi:MAG: restriction endonuclease subunit S [Chloroflexota bacterium]